MGNFRKILCIIACWASFSLASSLYAAIKADPCTSEQSDLFVDPNLPKMSSDLFGSLFDKAPNLNAGSSTLGLLFSDAKVAITPSVFILNYVSQWHNPYKKHYLFTCSGTSPPSYLLA